MMPEHSETLRTLRDGNDQERLAAARRIVREGGAGCVAELRNLRALEKNSWVRSALDRAITSASRDLTTAEAGQGWVSTPADPESEDAEAQAIRNVTSILIHELRPLLRSTASAARLELSEYDASKTAVALGRLAAFVATMEKLQAASSSPAIVEFDLRDVVIRAIRELEYEDEQVVVYRRDPVPAVGDPELLVIAVRNLVANAVEASEHTRKRVIVNFDANDRENWIAVLDEGDGLPGNADRVWEPGQTLKSKKQHFGWGLPIAQRAVHSMGGTIQLMPREGGGTAGEIRWPRTSKEIL